MSNTIIRRALAGSALAALAALSFSANLLASDEEGWPQWRGPNRDGISTEKGWSVEGRAEPLWSMNVGMGYSAVSIVGGRLYTQGHNAEEEEDVFYCLDAETGEEIWAHVIPAKIWKRAHGGGTLCTPSVDGEVVYALNREGNFFCFDAATGEVRWEKQLTEEYEQEPPTWMFATSPMVFDDMVVMNIGKVLAFDKQGELLWKTSKDYGHAYSTPAEIEVGGRSALAVFNGGGLAILERKGGKEIAFHEWKTKYDVNAATPVVLGSKIFISSGYNRGCAMLELKAKELEVVWENKNMRTQMSGCVLYEDHLFGYDESTFKCLGLDGEEQWGEKLGKAAFLLADGKLVLLTSRGELVIAEASSKEFKELSRKKVLDGGVNWTTPVLLDGLIYCRNSDGDLVCLDHRAK